jgi:dTDP-4-dehydrorhamnose reductase
MTRNSLSLSDPNISSFVFGASGLLGQAIYKCLPQKKSGTYNKKKFNSCQKFSFKRLNDNKIISLISKYQNIYYCIALSDPKECENNPKLSGQLNYLLPRKISDLCARMNKKFIYFSTEYVFKGNTKAKIKEENEPNNMQVYSRHKIAAENYIKKNNKNYLILRLAKIIGNSGHGSDFIQKWISNIKKSNEINIFTDQFVKPIPIKNVCIWTRKLAIKNCSGIFHLSGDEIYSRKALFEKFVRKKLKKRLQKKINFISCPSSLPKSLFLSNQKVKSILK